MDHKKFHVHHMVPRTLRGSDNFSNLVPLCAEHHSFVHLNGFDDVMRSKLSDFHKSIKSVDDIFIKSSVRGHAFIYTLRISKFKNWENRESFLKKKKVDYLNSNIANGQGHRIIINGFKVVKRPFRIGIRRGGDDQWMVHLRIVKGPMGNLSIGDLGLHPPPGIFVSQLPDLLYSTGCKQVSRVSKSNWPGKW